LQGNFEKKPYVALIDGEVEAMAPYGVADP
jgi:hypothetical protein